MSQQSDNQSPIHAGYNAYTGDGVLMELTKELPKLVRDGFTAHGKWVGSSEALDLARMANENPPKLKTHDAKGSRLDRVEFHPAYHALMRRGVSIGLNGSIWEQGGEEKGIRNFTRAVRFMLTSELEMGHTCPLTMTNASVAALMTQDDMMKDWVPRIISRDYDSSQRSPGTKKGLTIGMGMTERQGGSDVRANTTEAAIGKDGLWRVNGEKWFFSAPMCDAFLVLANTKKGLSCFLLPRLLPDGHNNGLQFQRLKDKLGNRSNASSEVTFVGSLGTLVGEEGAGIRTILEMVTLTRLDCILGSAGQMRAALSEAVHHCRNRNAFGKKLIDQPMMIRVLADLALEVAASQALGLRLAKSYDRAGGDDVEAGYARLMTPVVKYWVCKSAPAVIAEAMECIGGNGYVEESIMPRLYREAPLNGLWEGSGNIMCLDVLRVMQKGPKTVAGVFELLANDLGDRTNQTIDVLRIATEVALEDEGSARILTEQLALTAAAAEMRRSMPSELADAFIESRLGRPWRNTYGMMDARYNARAIVDYVCG
ncbi:MAG: acyl-CoA dehydrogenase family protein [Rhizobiaceae bacterium]